tara:strand:+ start:3726 stop:4733 length:1008 start_codon:yes stop_codon:yes gene_type:complete
MKKILFITTQYRVGERIYPILPNLSKDFEIHLLKLYQMHSSHTWPGSFDMRDIFNKKYLKYFIKTIPTINDIDYNKYDLILCDDDRARNGVEQIYKNKKCLMVGCSHGNRNLNPNEWHAVKHHKIAFDKCFIFGKKELLPHAIPGGIPSNDKLNKYSLEKNHILIICNFLGNRHCEFKISFDKYFFKECGLLELQQKYNKKIIIKLKSRADEGGYKHNIKYLNEILPKNLDYEILIDVEDDNKLIAQSFMVVSSPSTMTLKSIQLKIPTAVIKDSGQTGLFYDFKGFVNLNKEEIINTLKNQFDKPDKDFILNTIEGGCKFNSTEVFINQIKNLI